jgi:hypothetical protein
LSKKKKILSPQWELKLNSAPAAAETQHLEGCTLQVKFRRDGMDVCCETNRKCERKVGHVYLKPTEME